MVDPYHLPFLPKPGNRRYREVLASMRVQPTITSTAVISAAPPIKAQPLPEESVFSQIKRTSKTDIAVEG